MKPAPIKKILQKFTVFVVLASLFFLQLSTFNTPISKDVYAQAACNIPLTATDREVVGAFDKCMVEKDSFDNKAFSWDMITGIVCALNNQVVGRCSLYPDEVNNVTASSGALAYSSKMVAALYVNPPVSGVTYLAGQIQKFNPVQPAYAQTGIGYDALKPVQKLWTVFRNAAYAGFILVFVVIGFMVMFRTHISAQAVATVQDSIPRLIIALILVTFSYAITGLMLDIMFVVLNVIIALLSQAGVLSETNANDAIFNKSIFGVITSSWTDLVGKTAGALNDLIGKQIGLGVLGKLFSWTLSGIGGLIVGIAALFIMFRIFVMLLMSYIMIIVMTLAAPFYFLIQALPGNNGAKEWFKQTASHIAVFPVVSLMIILAGVIAGISGFGGTEAGTLQNVGTQAAKFPLFIGGIDSSAIGKIIGLGILFMTPSAAELVKNSIGVKGGPNIGAGFGAIAAGGGAIGGAVQAPFRPIGQALGYRYGTSVVNRLGRFTGRGGKGDEPVADPRHAYEAHKE